MNTEEMLGQLKENLTEKRFRHTLGVAQEALRLAPKFNVDKDKAYVAALLHDCAKNFSAEKVEDYCKRYNVRLDIYSRSEKALIHAFLGSLVAEVDYGVEDEEILNAIYYHTTGRENMTPLEKLIYLADMTEPGREMPQSAQIRAMVEENIDDALIYAIGCSVSYVIKKGGLVHPDSIFAHNYLVKQRREKNDRQTKND